MLLATLAACHGRAPDDTTVQACSDLAQTVEGTWVDGLGCVLAEPLEEQCLTVANLQWPDCPTFDDVLAVAEGAYAVVFQSCDDDRTEVCWYVLPDSESCAIFDGDGVMVQLQRWGVSTSPLSVCCDGHVISASPVYGDPSMRCEHPVPYE